MTLVIDTPEEIEYFRLMVLKGRLKLELRGIRFRLSTLKAVNKELGTNYHSKQKALDHLEEYIDERHGSPLGDPL